MSIRAIRALNDATPAELDRSSEWHGLFFVYEKDNGVPCNLKLVGVDDAEFSRQFAVDVADVYEETAIDYFTEQCEEDAREASEDNEP